MRIVPGVLVQANVKASRGREQVWTKGTYTHSRGGRWEYTIGYNLFAFVQLITITEKAISS